MPPRAPQLLTARPASTSTAADVRDALACDRTRLANASTCAAWLRPGLSVAAGGIAVAHLVPEPARDSGWRSPAPTRAVRGRTGLIGVLLLAVLRFLWTHRGAVQADTLGADALRSSAAKGAPAPAEPTRELLTRLERLSANELQTLATALGCLTEAMGLDDAPAGTPFARRADGDDAVPDAAATAHPTHPRLRLATRPGMYALLHDTARG